MADRRDDRPKSYRLVLNAPTTADALRRSQADAVAGLRQINPVGPDRLGAQKELSIACRILAGFATVGVAFAVDVLEFVAAIRERSAPSCRVSPGCLSSCSDLS